MTIERMRTFLVLAVVVGCNGHETDPDAGPLPLDCPTYCEQIEKNCIDGNDQYPDEAHCMAVCASFTVGSSTVTDPAGNTLGCRIYHTNAPSRMDPAAHCAHAGPAGEKLMASPAPVCSDGNVCASFCTLQFRTCGWLDEPLPGDPKDPIGNSLFQYRNMADCMTICAGFDKTHPYSTTSAGDSLACRLNHTVRAALSSTSAMMECRHTGLIGTGPCEGTPTP